MSLLQVVRQDQGGGQETMTVWIRTGPVEQFPIYSESGAAPVALPTPAVVAAQGAATDETLAAGLEWAHKRALAIEYAITADGGVTPDPGDPGYLVQLRVDMVTVLNIILA